MNVAVDTAFLAHAVIPSQYTPDADAALEELLRGSDVLLASPALLTEISRHSSGSS